MKTFENLSAHNYNLQQGNIQRHFVSYAAVVPNGEASFFVAAVSKRGEVKDMKL